MFWKWWRQKTTILVMDRARISKSQASLLGNILHSRGFVCVLLLVDRAESDDPLQVLDLSHLPQADLEQIKGIAKETLDGKAV